MRINSKNLAACKLKRNKDIVVEKLDNELFMMDLDKGKYYHLNEVGSIILENLEKFDDIGSLLKFVKANFRGNAKNIDQEVYDFMLELNKKEVIEIVNDSLVQNIA